MRTQNQLGFIIKISNLKGFFDILFTEIAWCLQKLGMILENKVFFKFKFLNRNHFYDKMKLIVYQRV